MSRCKFAALALAAAMLAGCGSHVRATASTCTVHGANLAVDVRNSADTPLVHAQIVAEFYRNYKFVRSVGSATFAPVLDPGATRVMKIPLEVAETEGSVPMRCYITRAVYGDDSVEGEPVSGS